MSRRKTGRKKKSMFYKPAHHEYLAELVEMDDPESAKASSRKLLREFRNAKTRDKKVRVKRATVLAANRARAAAKRKNLSAREKREFKEIANIFEETAKKMKLPPKGR